jgi:site-specific DNA-methyltransferase (adenine-specific)
MNEITQTDKPQIAYSECYAQVFSRLFFGDCLEIMPQIESKSIDMIFADLPYGTTACKWDSIIDLDLLWSEYKRIIKDNGAIILTASQPFTTKLISSNYEMFKYEMIWNKCKSSNFMLSKKQILKMHENILVFYKQQPAFNPAIIARNPKDKRPANIGNTKVVEVTGQKRIVVECKSDTKLEGSVFELRDREYGLHPTQKPVKLMQYLLSIYTNKGDIVMDNTMGSGSTGVACKNLNRSFIGIEKDENYFKIAEQRINARTLFS